MCDYKVTWKAIFYYIELFLCFAQIAQLVEQRTENPRVAGSIPALGIAQERITGCLFYCLGVKL